jgi:hypothetical protein
MAPRHGERSIKQRDHELHHRRRGRNLGVLAVLIAFVALLFFVTVAKMGGNAGNPWG